VNLHLQEQWTNDRVESYREVVAKTKKVITAPGDTNLGDAIGIADPQLITQ